MRQSKLNGDRKFLLTFVILALGLMAGLMFREKPVVLTELLLFYTTTYGLYLNYNVKAKDIWLSKSPIPQEEPGNKKAPNVEVTDNRDYD